MTTTPNTTGGRSPAPEPRPGVNAELLDVQAVAQLLSCSPRHVYRLADGGKMPRPLKLRALVRWRRQTLLDWIAEGCPAVRKGGAS